MPIFSLDKSIEVLGNTPNVLSSLCDNLGNDWMESNEGDSTWTVKEVVAHLTLCESTNWIPRIRKILSDKDKHLNPLDMNHHLEMAKNTSLQDLLHNFKILRQRGIAEIISLNLTEEDLKKAGIHPELGSVTLRQLLSTWVVHDLNHIAQIARIMAKQYQEEVGPWSAYLPIINH
ncbi:MAG TPA: DinB family protein [Patescibacteria group bacterium]|nr:DinB family protein [Patescibacteria group bacterium]